jgi:hypothetical protein
MPSESFEPRAYRPQKLRAPRFLSRSRHLEPSKTCQTRHRSASTICFRDKPPPQTQKPSLEIPQAHDCSPVGVLKVATQRRHSLMCLLSLSLGDSALTSVLNVASPLANRCTSSRRSSCFSSRPERPRSLPMRIRRVRRASASWGSYLGNKVIRRVSSNFLNHRF